MTFTREDLTRQLAAVTADQNAPYSLIDDILGDVEEQFGPDAVSSVVDEAIEYIDARDGNACSVCGSDFRPGDATVPYGICDGWQQHAHVGGCPQRGIEES